MQYFSFWVFIELNLIFENDQDYNKFYLLNFIKKGKHK